jgi:dynein heavy chain 1, cytosolic
LFVMCAQVEDVLTQRVEAAVAAWTAAFATTATTSAATDSTTAAAAAATAGTTAVAHSLQLQPSIHEVLLRNGVLHLSPPLEQARHTWIRHLHSHVSTAALLPRLRSSRFAVFDEHDVSHSSSSSSSGTAAAAAAGGAADSYAEAVMKRLPVTVLQAAYTEIEAQLGRGGEYVGLWLRYQSLWDVTTQVKLCFFTTINKRVVHVLPTLCDTGCKVSARDGHNAETLLHLVIWYVMHLRVQQLLYVLIILLLQ